jgi:hypothetical protein
MEETEYFLTSKDSENVNRPYLGTKSRILDERIIKIICKGVRNVLLASSGDMMETWRRRSTSRPARTLKIYKDLPWGLMK